MLSILQGMLRGALRISLVAASVSCLTLTDTRVALGANWKELACRPIEAAAFPKSRFHVKCDKADGSIIYFALGVANQDETNRVFSFIATAVAIKKQTLFIDYDLDDTTGASIGC